ncbi:MAG: hypothetical protein AB4062_10840 [Crocosphaera sp.]
MGAIATVTMVQKQVIFSRTTVEKKAETFTVKIDNGVNVGSGVIVARLAIPLDAR